MILDGGVSAHQHVVPRWMSYLRSLETNEFGRTRPGEIPIDKQILAAFDAEIQTFKHDRAHRVGADLMERLVLAGCTDRAQEIAPLLVDDLRLSKPLREIAERLLGKSGDVFSAEATYNELIRLHRSRLRENPRNGIRWVELARIYTIKGAVEKAHEALVVARSLNPNDRYTARSLIRFLLHIREEKDAANVIGPHLEKIGDPWIKAAGLSALMIAGRNPKVRLFLEPKLAPDTDLFDNSEFFAACGMLNLTDGKQNSAKSFFRSAWVDPSGNVTTHAEWVTRALLPALREEAVVLKGMTPEAKAGRAFSCGEWDEMYAAIEDWKLEEPYSTKPFKFLASVSNIRGQFQKALDWAIEAEEKTDADFSLRVTKLYALLSLGRLEEAEKIINSFDPEKLKPGEAVVLLANLGFLFIQKGKVDDGLALYRKAEKDAARFSDDLATKVFINASLAARIAERKISEEDFARLKEMGAGYKHDIGVSLLLARIDGRLAQFTPPAYSSGQPAQPELKLGSVKK